MKSKYIKIILSSLMFLAVFYPVLVWFKNSNLDLDSTIFRDIFPVFGLLAFSIMWLHIVGGVFKNFFDKYINFQKFVNQTSVIVLIFLILHPTLFLVHLTSKQIISIFTTGQPIYVWLGVISWIIFICYDIAKISKIQKFLNKYWQTIRFISTVPFFLILIHSLELGSDLQKGPLRFLWIFYGITALFATFYTYIFNSFIKK